MAKESKIMADRDSNTQNFLNLIYKSRKRICKVIYADMSEACYKVQETHALQNKAVNIPVAFMVSTMDMKLMHSFLSALCFDKTYIDLR